VRNHRPFLALALAALLAPGLHARQPLAARVDRVGDSIVFTGQINPRSAARFLQLLQQPGVRRLVISSPGGNVAAALDMAEAIHAHQLDLSVPAACLSSCANYIFPAARRKTLGAPGVVGWHGNMAHVLYLQQAGRSQWPPADMREARQLARREAAFFRGIGVDGFVCWFGKIAPYAVDDFYGLSVADMARFGIREVEVLAPHGRVPAGVQPIAVDWATLESSRPTVRLE
jgi:hypothetical protein